MATDTRDDYTVDVSVENMRDAVVEAHSVEEAERLAAERVDDEHWPDAILNARALEPAGTPEDELTEYTVDVWTEETYTETVRSASPDEAESEAIEVVDNEYWPDKVLEARAIEG